MLTDVEVQFDLSNPDDAELYLELIQKIIAKQASKRVQPARGITDGTQILPVANLPTPISWVQMEPVAFTPESEEDKASSLEEAIQRYMVNGVRKVFL